MELHRDTHGSFYNAEDPGEPTTGIRRLSITEEEAAILSALAMGREVLEIGTGLGVSTRALASTAEYVYTHDVDPWVHVNVWPEFDRDEKIITVEHRGQVPLYCDMVFIDADHATTAVLADIALARAGSGAPIIVCHDALYPNVAQALPEGAVLLKTHHGLAVFQ